MVQPPKPVEILGSRNFVDWMTSENLSLAFTTYEANKLFMVGRKSDGKLAINERTIQRCMGLCCDGQTMWMTSQYQVWRFENVLTPQTATADGDRLFVPRAGYTIGDVDAHDIAVDADGQPVFVNTLFGCLAGLSDRWNFAPLWRPPFISKLAAEDRCHLNGLAMRDGQSAYVTACSQSDIVDGWRDRRTDGGVVIDVASQQVIADGFSMPHSPRWYRNELWMLNSGNGYFGKVDTTTGKFEPVAFCPGYARGLAFHGDFAVVGLSKPRDRTFSGLPLDAELQQRDADARCGLQVIDLRSGDTVHWLRIEGVVSELYDVVVLPGVARPRSLGFKTEEIRRNVWVDDDGRLSSWIGVERNK